MQRGLRYITVCLLLVASVGSAPAEAQDDASREIELEADSLAGGRINGAETFQLVNVRLRQGDTYLTARRGWDEGNRHYLFEGDVRIIEKGDTIHAETVRYDGTTHVGRALGNVRMTDGGVTIRSVSALYYADERRTVFNQSVSIRDSVSEMVAAGGTYWSEASRARLHGRVRLRQEALLLVADSLDYDRKNQLATAVGSVYAERGDRDADTHVSPTGFSAGPSTVTYLLGDRLFHNRSRDSTAVTGRATMLRVESDSTGTDSLVIRSAALILIQDSTRQRLVASDSVTVLDASFEMVGDSLVYTREEGLPNHPIRSAFYGRPAVWVSNSRVRSDSLHTFGRGSALDSLVATGNVFVATDDSASGRIQQMRGRHLLAIFRNDSLETMTIQPNAEALYFMEDDSTETPGAVRASADRIVLRFEGGDIADIRVYEGVEGTWYPENLLDQARNLTGYGEPTPDRPSRSVVLSSIVKEILARRGHSP